MTDKELRKLSRIDLLQMFLESRKMIEELNEKLVASERKIEEQQLVIESNDSLAAELEDARCQIDDLHAQLDKAHEEIEDKEIAIDETGSIAEASLQLNGVFQAAQAAADQYVSSVKARYKDIETRCMLQETESRMKAERMIEDAKVECESMKRKAQEEADRYWRETSWKLREMVETHNSLSKLFKDSDLGR